MCLDAGLRTRFAVVSKCHVGSSVLPLVAVSHAMRLSEVLLLGVLSANIAQVGFARRTAAAMLFSTAQGVRLVVFLFITFGQRPFNVSCLEAASKHVYSSIYGDQNACSIHGGSHSWTHLKPRACFQVVRALHHHYLELIAN